MAAEQEQLHFLLIPLLSQSHIIPLTDFAKLLAARGPTVSIITTPHNATRYSPTVARAAAAGLDIRMLPLDFPAEKAGLPLGCENMDSLSSMDLARPFFAACELLEAPLRALMAELRPRPSCIVSTNALPWTQRVANAFHIPRYIFETVSCFTLFCSHALSAAGAQEAIAAAGDSESFLVPDIPHAIEFTKDEMPQTNSNKSNNEDIGSIVEQIKRARSSSRATLVNTFEEMEAEYVEGYRKEARTLWCIGPVSLSNKNLSEKMDRGDKASINEQDFMSWLDSKAAESVIYACFGSLCRISFEQIKEIGLGLEGSGFPFIWIIRGMDSSKEVEKWLKEEGFEDRVRERGLVIRGWAPQVLILSHPSVGGFLTHCGWNSTLEGVAAGVPMATWPMFAEQFYNEKFIVQVLGIGVRVRSGGVKGAVVERERVRRAIGEVMEGGERRRRARELAGMAREALEEGGSSYVNISLFIHDVLEQVTPTNSLIS